MVEKIINAIANHFSKPIIPLLSLLGKIPVFFEIAIPAAINEFKRVLLAATGPRK